MTVERQSEEKEFQFPKFSPMRPRHWDTTLPRTKREAKKYIYEPKWNGIRGKAEISAQGVVLRSMTGRIITSHFPELIPAFETLKRHGNLIIDGEIVSGLGTTIENQRRAVIRSLSKPPQILPRDREFSFMAFDLPFYRDDLRQKSLMYRKKLLTRIIHKDLEARGLILTPVHTDPQAMMQNVEDLGLEGMLSKLKSSRYHSGYRNEWVKLRRSA